jgi:hypothetical protein
MDESLRFYMVTFIVGALFFVGLLSWAAGVASNNNANQSVTDDSKINGFLTSTRGNIGTTEDTVNSGKSTFDDNNPTVTGGNIVLNSMPGIGRIFSFSFITGFYNITIGLILNLFQLDPLIISVIGSILMITIIFLIWRLLRTGE